VPLLASKQWYAPVKNSGIGGACRPAVGMLYRSSMTTSPISVSAWFASLRRRGLSARLAALAIVVSVAFAIVAPVAIGHAGSVGLAAAAVAAVLCLLGAAVALAIGDRFRRSGEILAALWVGTALRIGIPFVAGMPIHLHGGSLAQAGLLWYLLGFYLVVLATGTILSLPPTSRQPPQTH
jgi:hypothetical protein